MKGCDDIKIGLFTDTYYPQINGVATSVLTLKNNLEAMGHEVYVFTTTEPKALKGEKNVFRMSSVKFSTDNRLAIFYYPRIVRKAKNLKLDVIHTHTEFTIGRLGHHIAKESSLPLVHTMHTIYEDFTHFLLKIKSLSKMSKPAARLMTKQFCNFANIVIAPTNKTKRLLIDYGVEKSISVIPTGIELDMFKNTDNENLERNILRSQNGIGKEDKVLLYIGRISKEKNIDELIKLLAGYLPKRPDVKFVLIGNGQHLDELKQLSIDLNISKQVIFTGQKPWKDIGYYYRIGDIFVNASQSETQGLTYIEALASGLPIIAKKDECLEDVLIEGENGFVFTQKEQLYKALDTLLDNAELRKKMSEFAVQSIEKFTAKQYAESVLNIYTEAISRFHINKNN
ncbi:glycosyltransferase family 4 protein [Eubacteriales bacterium OttesenSCG-928-G02]|nr:glycosyltransferase family 4 protein [Eubacteriales bacterium OttesenSCG-928-G02]